MAGFIRCSEGESSLGAQLLISPGWLVFLYIVFQFSSLLWGACALWTTESPASEKYSVHTWSRQCGRNPTSTSQPQADALHFQVINGRVITILIELQQNCTVSILVSSLIDRK